MATEACKRRKTETEGDLFAHIDAKRNAWRKALSEGRQFFNIAWPSSTEEEFVRSLDYQEIDKRFSREVGALERKLHKLQARTMGCIDLFSNAASAEPTDDLSLESNRNSNSGKRNGITLNVLLRGEMIENSDDTQNCVEGGACEDCSYEDELEQLEVQQQVEKVQKSKLQLALEALRAKDTRNANTGVDLDSAKTSEQLEVESCESMELDGRKYFKGRCYMYQYQSRKHVVGLVKFLSGTEAAFALIVPFSDTFLGREEEDFKMEEDFKIEKVQIEIDPILLSSLGEECPGMQIPELAHEPQGVVGSSLYNFSYFYVGKKKRCGLRSELRLLELFSGCGGMGQGFKNCNFKPCLAVEKDELATKTYKANHPGSPVARQDVNMVLLECQNSPELREEIGPVHHIHASPPCQGFSGANVFGGKNDKANNELSYCFVEAIKTFRPVTATFENVVGIWQSKHIHYLKKILVDLLQLGYQVRCCKLESCDYGDPQKRPRIFIFAARRDAYLPPIPEKTHGLGTYSTSLVTVQDALDGFAPTVSDVSNLADGPAAASSKDDMILDPHTPACTIRASKSLPFHYKYNRRINIEEAAALFSFPPGYKFVGSPKDQRRQIGNSVPVELATAVALSVRSVLKHVYAGEETA